MNRNYTINANGVRYESKSMRRFLRHVRTIKWKETTLATLRVSYGTGKDVFGKEVTFNNEGEYTNKKDFEQALTAFME